MEVLQVHLKVNVIALVASLMCVVNVMALDIHWGFVDVSKTKQMHVEYVMAIILHAWIVQMFPKAARFVIFAESVVETILRVKTASVTSMALLSGMHVTFVMERILRAKTALVKSMALL